MIGSTEWLQDYKMVRNLHSPVIDRSHETKKVKNIILLIGDGMGFSYTTGLRYLNHIKENQQKGIMAPTIFDQFFVGIQSTYSFDPISNVTDSAAAGTALATGFKTLNGAIGVNVDKKPVPSILEYAKYRGKSTGLIGTCQINHATLAAFAAHNEDRNQYNKIADDYLDDRINGRSKIDVMLGGGSSYFIREDRNLIEEFLGNQYGYARNLQQLLKNKDERLVGLFAPVELPKAIDRHSNIPSLRDMTKAALKRLEQNKDGFFLLVEGSQIDWAAHDNDIVGAMSELKDFEGAFKEAIDFARDREDTMVVATADHSTGGMSIDRDGNYLWNPDLIRSMTSTPLVIAKILHETKDLSRLKDNLPINLNEEESKAIKDSFDMDVEATRQVLIQLINHHSSTGWTTKGHTGEDVPIFAYGIHKHHFSGRIENSDLARLLFQLMD